MSYVYLYLIALATLTGQCQSTTPAVATATPATGADPQPVLLAPGVINRPGSWSFTPAISVDGNTMILVRWDDPDYSAGDRSLQKLYRSERVNGQWSEPTEIAATRGHRVDYPHFSPDGRFFYLSYNRYHAGQYNYPNETGWDDFDIWRADCDAAGHIDWATFAPLGYGDINRAKTPANRRTRYVYNETSPRADLQGNLYFWSERPDMGIGRRDVYRYRSGVGTELLPAPVNSPFRESGVCITRDGRRLIFASNRPGGYGGQDLYLTELRADGSWSEPTNLGPTVNSPADEFCPQLAFADTQLLFTSSRPIPGYAPVESGEGAFTFGVYQIKFSP